MHNLMDFREFNSRAVPIHVSILKQIARKFKLIRRHHYNYGTKNYRLAECLVIGFVLRIESDSTENLIQSKLEPR